VERGERSRSQRLPRATASEVEFDGLLDGDGSGLIVQLGLVPGARLSSAGLSRATPA
jgi:hypothetical protein